MKIRLAAVLLCLSFVLCSFSSCNYIISDPTNLISPPKASGEMYYIQSALTKYAGSNIRMKYPTGGENTSAFLITDLDGDAIDEAVAFYTRVSEDESVAPVHVNLLKYDGEQWKLTCDIVVEAGSIDRVSTADLTGDGINELLIGFGTYTASVNKLVAYSVNKSSLTEILNDEYNEFVLTDLSGNGFDELLLINYKPADKKAYAKLYSFLDRQLTLKGTVPLDGNIGGFASITTGRLTDGTAAVFIDSYKGVTSMVTDLVFIKNGVPVNPFYDELSTENQMTLRDSVITCRDIDGDGLIEIPFTSVMQGYQTSASIDTAYLYTWMHYDGSHFSNVCVGDFCFEHNYAVRFSAAWQSAVTVVIDRTNNMRSYRVWDQVTGTTGAELLRTRVYSESEFADVKSDEIMVLERSKGKVYAARIVDTGTEYKLTESDVRNMFFTF